MILAYGSLAGQPEFAGIIQMIVVKDALLFIVRKLSTSYWEHYRAFVTTTDLTDPYPLAEYIVGRSCGS